ncbi:MAG: hypothetical protein GTN71_22915 [Anaerolineae bacterium]|nr:hypothetical protein [Anaerolineae bacterium]
MMSENNQETAQPKGQLDPNEILIAEFNYIAQTAFQAHEDRARVWQYYLATVGTFVVALFSMTEMPSTWINLVRMAFGVAFAVLAMAGYLTLQQLIRLRGAWMESARAMNQIKDFYADRLDLAPAFLWRTTTLPKADKKDSVAFLLALAVMVMDAFALVLALSFLGLAINEARGPWAGMGVGVVAAVLAVIWQLRLYQRKLAGSQ